MVQKYLTLLSTRKLTHNVYGLIFVSDEKIVFSAGQFLTFILPSGLRRAYSIAGTDGNRIEFFVKLEAEGRGGSKELCNLEIGTKIGYNGPSGKFVLKDSPCNKLFICTGTGIVPVYRQVVEALENEDSRCKMIFGVRKKEDILMEDSLKDLKSENSNFDYAIYLSRENNFNYRKGYVSDYLNRESVWNFGEFYLCGSPHVIKDIRNKLENLGVPSEKIYFEQY